MYTILFLIFNYVALYTCLNFQVNVGKIRKFITLCRQKYVIVVKQFYLAQNIESYRPYNFNLLQITVS